MRTVIIGLDAFDPTIFERLVTQGEMPHLGALADSGGYSRFTIANPAQSEVSWSSIATGSDPGGHGLFDFVHRNPTNYTLHPSLLPTKTTRVGTQFIPPHSAHTIFDETVQDGFPATSLWWPATFPAQKQSPVRTIPGLGTPDILGRLGVGILFSNDQERHKKLDKTDFGILKPKGVGVYKGSLEGPSRKKRGGTEPATIDFELDIIENDFAQLKISNKVIELQSGVWSSIIELKFKVGLGITVSTITRAILSQTNSETSLPFLPLQIHPLRSPWHYATPPGFVKNIWNNIGPYLTLGWPQDTTALEEGCITNEQFLDLCESILLSKEKVFSHLLGNFNEGLLACVFDTMDRVQHMFWREAPEIIDQWYIKLDSLYGRLINKIPGPETNIITVSDHGFTPFNYKIHLNRWLLDNNYLQTSDKTPSGSIKTAIWSNTKFFACGLNSVYLNLQGREGEGIVLPHEQEMLLSQITSDLLGWVGPDNNKVVSNVWRQNEIFSGPLSSYGPDLVVGYAPGYRASAETGLGGWEKSSIEVNKDHWGGDHCIDPAAVPGVIFRNKGLENFSSPSFRDFPMLAIGKELKGTSGVEPPEYSQEDQEVVEKRLKDLGYF